MTKYYFLVLLSFGLYCSSYCNSLQIQKPNIIIINVDDLGWKDLGYMGSEYYETPNIDQLSKLGMQFTNGYAAAANCAPSRASLMTGKFTTSHGIYTVGTSQRGLSKHRKLIPTENKTTLHNEQITLAQILKENGYFNIHAGKWHISESPLDFGFDINIAGAHNGNPTSYYPPYGNIDLSGDKILTDVIMEKIISHVNSVSQPFFLNYAPYAVHTPIQAIDSLLPKYKNKLPSNGQDNAAYATMIENLDKNIGMLITALQKRDLFNNTLIILTSDNGGLYGITNQHPLRAGKGSYYEGGIREPFFFVMENKIRPNTSSDIPITNLDIFPTILEFAGINSEQYKLDGANLKPILQGKISQFDRPLFWHFPIYLEAYNAHDNENRDSLFRTRPGSVVRYGKWKLHYYFENNEVELYDLHEDIGEKNNLAPTEAAKTEELLIYLQKWWNKTNAPIPKELNSDFRE